MNLKKEYTNLYQHWLAEFDQAELTQFLQDDFNSYKSSVNTIKAIETEDKDNIKSEILATYKEHFEYLFEDLLKIRKIKIMNAALAMQDINFDNILEPEKLLYKNLISTMKGYKKLKALSLSEDVSNVPDLPESVLSFSDVEKFDDNEPIIEKNESEKVMVEEQGDIGKKISKQMKNYNYTVIRFLKKSPPLVGIDLINYGPFNENDIASMPYKNAIILINEKIAEQVEFS